MVGRHAEMKEFTATVRAGQELRALSMAGPVQGLVHLPFEVCQAL